MTLDEDRWVYDMDSSFRWTVAALRQLERIKEGREVIRIVRVGATHRDKQWFSQVRADVHFLFNACHQLRSSLGSASAVDPRVREVAAQLRKLPIPEMRDALEHPLGGRAPARFAQRFPDQQPTAHGWITAETGWFGPVDEAALRQTLETALVAVVDAEMAGPPREASQP